MKIFEARGTRKIVQGRLRQRFKQLADNALRFMEGEESELIGRT